MITFSGHSIVQQRDGWEKTWTPAELLESPEPLKGEPLVLRTTSMQRALPLAEEVFDQLSERALLCYHFWKQLVPNRIEEQVYEYTVKTRNNYRWKLTVNAEGLFYQDLDAMYGQLKGQVYEQLFSDFWFYGPMMPVPELATRKWIVARIRNAFMQVGPVAYRHFKLFEYPALAQDEFWEESDSSVQFFVNLRQFGIEYGKTTWYDGLVYLNFLSFEHFLVAPEAQKLHLAEETRTAILKHLSRQETKMPDDRDDESHTAEMKRMFMENGGMHHYIYREYGKGYQPAPLEEQQWRRELVDKYMEQLRHEDRESVISYLTSVLQYNGVQDVEELLFCNAKEATPKARQAFSKVLDEQFKSDKAVEILVSLLEFAEQDNYWLDYVFNTLFRMRHQPVARAYIRECLEGDDEVYFNKAVEVLQMWAYFGDKALAALLPGLNWSDASADDPSFRETLAKVVRLINI
ncbi:MAG: hypothetical protein R2824_15000 [Saprospiraceae bacterium]|nr:hypothetical protein [Lewinella sp.]